MDSDINVNTSLSRIILGTENSEEWLVVATRSSFMPKNHISNRFYPIAVPGPNFPDNNFRITMVQAGGSYSKEWEMGYQ